MRGEHGRRCRKQPLGTKEHANCIKKLSESIILQCIEDLWDKASMKTSVQFFSRRGFGICAGIAGMDICDQVKLLDIVNCAISRIHGMSCIESAPKTKRITSTAANNA